MNTHGDRTVVHDAEFTSIVKHLIELCRGNSKRYADQKFDLSPLEYVIEFGTIHLNFGRRTGKTGCINELATEKDVIYIKRLSLMNLYNTKAKIITDSIMSKAKGLTPDIIWIDEPFMMRNMNIVLPQLIRRHDQMVIMLGR